METLIKFYKIMATLYDFFCTNCDYTFMMVGEPSMMMSDYTISVVCEKCKDIGDLLELFWEDGTTAIESNWKMLRVPRKEILLLGS